MDKGRTKDGQRTVKEWEARTVLRFFIVLIALRTTFAPTFANTALAQGATGGRTAETPPIQENTAPEVATPEITIAPWHLIGIQPEIRTATAGILQSTQRQMATRLATAVQSLSDYLAPTKSLPRNLARRTDAIFAGTARRQIGRSVTYEPLLCSIGDHGVIFVTASDTKTQILLALAHSAFSMPHRPYGRDREAARAALPIAVSLAAQVERALRTPAAPGDALKVGLALARPRTRRDQGANECLNLLLQESLVQRFRLVGRSVSESLTTIQRAVAFPKSWRAEPFAGRSTRYFNLHWALPSALQSQPSPLPSRLTMTADLAESVLASPTAVRYIGQYQLQVQGDRIALTTAQDFARYLEDESKALQRQDQPAIAAIDRAWVFLDRGRAWGLKLNDRLLIGETPSEIKGHVVGFYGPERRISSSRGYPVREGAIVFVRKGQRKTRIGQSVVFDLTKYPTPWPPGKK